MLIVGTKTRNFPAPANGPALGARCREFKSSCSDHDNSKAYSINCCKPFFVGNRVGNLLNFWAGWTAVLGVGDFGDRGGV